MSGVVIRCPNCGTTQASSGTCEACHEAETRHFCSNHEPGRWLDGPACDSCGARVGVPGRAPEPARRSRRGPASDPPRETPRAPDPRTSRGAPPSREATWDAPLEGPVRGPGAGRDPEPEEELVPWPFTVGRGGVGGGPLDPSRHPEMPGGRMPEGMEPPWVPIDPAVIVRGAARGAMGCVMRLAVAVIVLLVLAFLLVGGFFSGAFGAEPGATRGNRPSTAGYVIGTSLDGAPRRG